MLNLFLSLTKILQRLMRSLYCRISKILWLKLNVSWESIYANRPSGLFYLCFNLLFIECL